MDEVTQRNAAGRRRATLVWKVCLEAFGRRWTREMGDQPTAVWVSALEGVDDDAVATAVRKVMAGAVAHPPDLSAFIALGRAPKRTGEQAALYGRLERDDGQARLPSLAELASTTLTGRAWFAFMQLRGFIPRTEATDEGLLAIIAAAGLTVEELQERHDRELARATRRWTDG